jgi:NAD(P)H-dependent FMN reductase
MNIEIISGSPRSQSVTNRVAVFLQKELASKTAHNIGLIDVREWNMPLLENVIGAPDQAPEHLQTLANRMFAADAFILVTPEYNGSYSAALQNLLDHFPKQSRKAFGLVTGSPGGLAGARASQQLLLLVPALFGIAAPNMLLIPFLDKKFSPEGELTDPAFQKSVDTFTNEFIWLAEALQAK